MSAVLVARSLAGGHADRTLFADLDLVVAPGSVVGLVGVNGAGKSTLLRILAGEEPPLVGTVRTDPPTAAVGYLPQEPDRRKGETILAHLARRTGVTAAQASLDAATHALEVGAPGADDAYADAFERWLALGAADLEERVDGVLAELGIPLDTSTAMTSLSGGQAARVSLAGLLLARFDVVLLDEPTNDLDLDGLERLERVVSDLRTPVVLVSHDREFLARTVTAVLELDLPQQQVRLFGGGYDAYLAEREVARRRAREAYDDYADTRSGLQDRARVQRGWAEKGVKNALKKRPDNDKVLAKFRADSSEKQAAKARQTERMIERLDVVEEPRKQWQLHYEIAAAPRGSAVVLAARAATVSRGGFTLGPVDLQVDVGDRVAVTGPNGAGKSTLLAMLLGRLAPDSGTSERGSSVAIGEVDQVRGLFVGEQPLLESFATHVPELATAELRTLLAKFGLGADHVRRPAGGLSPGERTRAALALLQARGVNLLVLDEPTNHLDLPAIEQLEQALEVYPGTLLLVTHDRRMLDAVRVDRRWHVDAGSVTEA